MGRGDAARERRKLLRTRAKAMRSAATDAEHRLWQILRAKRFADYKFKRQVPIDHYIVDFACLRQRLIVEADGGQHADKVSDDRRDRYLNSQGFRVLRIWNNDVFTNEEGVCEVILAALSAPHPAQPVAESPSPSRGEGICGAQNG